MGYNRTGKSTAGMRQPETSRHASTQQEKAIREYRKFKKIYPFSAFLYSLSMYPRVLCAAFCSVRIFYPQSFIQEQPRAPGAIRNLR